jgi:eukaryotic-like serine/threonine-protein kinase
MKKELSANTSLSYYRIVAPLGAGGMGEVYLAEDTRLRRKIALKVLPESIAQDKERLRRFEQEAFAASALNHPNILTIHEFGAEGETHYLAAEFIDGETLRNRLQRAPLTLNEALDIAVQVIQALAAAHEAKIIHRDIKPENVMIRRDGIVKVLDFGLAKLTEVRNEDAETLVQAESNNPQLTMPGTVMGTVAYMSPEQARGNVVDARTDIFSLGVMLYEMLARRQPFMGETVNHVIVAILEQEPPPLAPDVPAELARILKQMLAKQADDRYASAQDLLADLKKLQMRLLVEAENKRNSSDSEPVEAQTMILPQTTAAAPAGLGTAAAGAQPTSADNTKLHKWWLVAGLRLVLAVGGYFGYGYFTATRQIESIAVLPFINASGNADVEYLSDGMTETLIKSLSQLPNLNVKSRSSLFRYKGKETDAKTIGKELNVEAILNGRLVQRGDQLTLNLELTNAQTENVIWTDQYDRKSSDLVALQNVIARDVSSKLKIQLSGADLEKLAKNYTNDPEAYRLYLQGRFYWNKRTGVEFERAEDYFQQAVARDPNFALGYVGLADFKEDNDRPRKKEYIRRALEIDNQLAEAHASLGYQYMMDYNWAESERELKRAIELKPNYPQAHQWNGMRLMMNGKYDEARVSLTRALELDPTAAGINAYYGALLEVSGRITEGIQQYKKLIEMEPTYSWAHIGLARLYRRDGNYEGCVEERALTSELLGNEERAKAIRESFAKGGWKAHLRTFPPNDPSALAELGEYEKAIEAVVKQGERGWFWFFLNRTDPFLDPIRDDPRFKEAMKKLDPPQ